MLFRSARFGDSIVTYQLSPDGERWLKVKGYRDGASIDGDTIDYLRNRGALYTEGSGPGHIEFDLASGALIAPLRGTWVKHSSLGIGRIVGALAGARCRVAFLKDAANVTRDVPTAELQRPKDLEVARERELAWRREEQARKALPIGRPELREASRPAEKERERIAPPTPSAPNPDTVARTPSKKGCLRALPLVVLLVVFIVLLLR